MPAAPDRVRRPAIALLVAWAVTWLVNRSLVAVRGPSMLPTLPPGTRLLTVPAWLRAPTVGRVVVVADPTDPGHRVVKRVADGGRDGLVVLGDNPAHSTDSRRWGPVPRSAVRRVVVARWPSLSRQGLLERGPSRPAAPHQGDRRR
jgi:nickel-type superoxide dismutase maturation protease